MKEQEIKESNLLIAAFMGLTVYPEKISTKSKKGWKWSREWHGERCDVEIFSLKYHSSWSHLMPVIEKIESLDTFFDIKKSHVFISGWPIGQRYEWNGGTGMETKIQSAWTAVIDFIKWYNKTKTP